MKMRQTGLAAAAGLLLATVALATAQTQAPAFWKERLRGSGDLSPEVRDRLHDGRMAMIREALRLDVAQLKLWAPVEAQLRARFATRQRARAERQERRRQGAGRPSLPDRLDRTSQRLAERAERAKALAEAFRPFYASLDEEQKAVADLVLRRALRGPRPDRRHRFMRRASAAEHR